MKLSLFPLLGLIAASSAQTISCGNVGDSTFTTASGKSWMREDTSMQTAVAVWTIVPVQVNALVFILFDARIHIIIDSLV